MNSIVLRTLAAVLAAGALLAAWLGYRLGSAPPQPEALAPPPPPAVMSPVVLASRPIAPGQVIGAEDVVLGSVEDPAPRGFARVDAVVGRLAVAPVVAGEPLRPEQLARPGAVTQLLAAGERAVAIKVDEVVAVGGYLRPGDRVDILLYLRGERETADQTSAQVVVENLRVLAVGEVLPEAVDSADSASGADARTRDEGRKKAGASRSVVLGVPVADSARLMLAASAGSVRLALRGIADTAQVAPARPVRLADVAGGTPAPAQAGPRAAARPAPSGHRVIGHQGDQVRVDSVGAR